ncbi:transposable element Tcb2 transposase [Trichonephila clavipes]|nr:transposable element Tcb2 transposase [Trichonephila clavipes]
MAVKERATSSMQLAAHWSTATGVLMSASSFRRCLRYRGLRARVPLYRIPLTANYRRLHESRFNLWDHDGRIRVRLYGGERCIPECVIERHSGITPAVMVWGAISYHGRSNLVGIKRNLKSNRYVHEVQQPEVVPFLQRNAGAIFQQDNARPHMCKDLTILLFIAKHMQLLRPACSPDMSPLEHVWDLVGQHLARDPRPAASKDELLLRIQAMWNSLQQADIQNPTPCHVV